MIQLYNQYPAEITPLAKRQADDPLCTYVSACHGGGVENIKAFSELNDPIDQEARFAEQTIAENGDEEAQLSDTDFVEALKHSASNSWFCIGIDRLTATRQIRQT